MTPPRWNLEFELSEARPHAEVGGENQEKNTWETVEKHNH